MPFVTPVPADYSLMPYQGMTTVAPAQVHPWAHPDQVFLSQTELPAPYEDDYLRSVQEFLEEALRINSELEQSRPPDQQDPGQTETTQGNLRVIAGNRYDGVLPERIVIHEKGDWSSRQFSENFGYQSFEGQYTDGEIGQTHQVTVEWADGSRTVRDVTLDSPEQVIFINSSYLNPISMPVWPPRSLRPANWVVIIRTPCSTV